MTSSLYMQAFINECGFSTRSVSSWGTSDLVYVKLSGVRICDVQWCIKSKLAAMIAFAVTYWVVKNGAAYFQ